MDILMLAGILNKHSLNRDMERHKILFEKFKKEVLSKFIESDHISKSSWGGNFTELHLCSCNKHYKDSIFYYKKENKFIHFTSLEKLNLILQSNTIRLYNLVHQKDPEEFKYSSSLLGVDDIVVDFEKKNSFILSMCELYMKDDLLMWKKYGDKTKGVGIIIEFEDDLNEWMSFHLSEVYYGEQKIFSDYIDKKTKFEKQHNFKFHLPLNRFLSFFKSPGYYVENEIRLLYYLNQNKSILNPNKKRDRVVTCHSGSEFIQLELSNRLKEKTDRYKKYIYLASPKPMIRKVIVGPNLDDFEMLKRIKNEFPEIVFEESKLKGKFKM